MLQLVALVSAIGTAAAYVFTTPEQRKAKASASPPEQLIDFGAVESGNGGADDAYAYASEVEATSAPRPPDSMLMSSRRDFTQANVGSLEERMRYYTPDVPKREVANADLHSTVEVDNVFVRDNTKHVDDQRDRINNMYMPLNNVTPVATSTGTAYHLVGPGLAVDRDAPTGNHGLHYGSVRIRPNPDIVPQHREMRGGVGAAASTIQKPLADIGEVIKKLPARFFEVPEEYTTSAKGRSIYSAPSHHPRPECGAHPTERSTYASATDLTLLPRGAGGDGSGIPLAPPARSMTERLPRDSRTRGQGYAAQGGDSSSGAALNYGPASGNQTGGYGLTMDGLTSMPLTQRAEAEMECRGTDVYLGAAGGGAGGDGGAPGLRAGAYNDGSVPQTQRGEATRVFPSNLAIAAPAVGSATMNLPNTQVRETQRAGDAYRESNLTRAPGGAYVSSAPMAQSELDRVAQRRETLVSMREGISKAAGDMGKHVPGPKSLVNNARLYDSVTKNELYANDVPHDMRLNVAAAVIASFEPEAFGVVDQNKQREIDSLNAGIRGADGNIGSQAMSNYYVRNGIVESNPNKAPVYNTRSLDLM